MFQTSLYPLRTLTGEVVPIVPKVGIRKIAESPRAAREEIEYSFHFADHMTDTVQLPEYASLLPAFRLDGRTFAPGDGVATLPVPAASYRPFELTQPVASIFAMGDHARTGDISHDLSVTFSLRLARRECIGGVCIGGYPYLPYRLTKLGENSANFGLPREIRVTGIARSSDERNSAFDSEFLDFDLSTTNQEITSHSGFHVIAIDPVLTDRVLLRLSDFPSFITSVMWSPKDSDRRGKIEERWGFAIPYLYVFSYREGTRYRPTVPAGAIATTSNLERPAHIGELLGTTTPASMATDVYHFVETDAGGRYFPFTAPSVFGQQRRYGYAPVPASGASPQPKPVVLHECFISNPVQPGGSVTLVVEQSEEFPRTVAGIRVFLPFVPERNLESDLDAIGAQLAELGLSLDTPLGNLADLPRETLEAVLRALTLQIPSNVNFCEKQRIEVFEIDPPDGTSPVGIALDSRFATRLAVAEIDELSEMLRALYFEGIRFRRPSALRTFAIRLTNIDLKTGQFVVKSLDLVQSAHVSVQPRATRSQSLGALNFRLIGPGLADDYSSVGGDGMTLTVERLVAGQPKGVLFRATSLLDLITRGGARIINNVRRRAVEAEISRHGEDVDHIIGINAPNFEDRYSESRSSGWHRAETGDDVDEMARITPQFESWYANGTRANEHGIYKWPGSFEMFSSQELRSHTRSLFPDHVKPQWYSAAMFANALGAIYKVGDLIAAGNIVGAGDAFVIPTYTYRDHNGVHELARNFGRFWQGIDTSTLRVEGLTTLNQSPYSVTVIGASLVQDLVDALTGVDLQEPNVVLLVQKLVDLLPAIIYALTSGLPGSPTSAIALIPVLNGLSTSINAQPAGLGATLSASASAFLPTVMQNGVVGSSGTITKQAAATGFSMSQHLVNGLDEGNSYTRFDKGLMKRLVTRRAVSGTERINGAEVMWQGELVDIVTGTIPLNVLLPATATKRHVRTTDEAIRVRFGSGVNKAVSVDAWFDVVEEPIRDDY